jgi:signal transduction histidine kinase
VRPRVAWALAGATLVLVVLDAVVSAQAVSLTSETAVAVHGFPFVHGAVLGSSVMGALIIARYERHPIGWLLAIVGITSAVSLLTEAYAYWVQESGGPGSSSLGGVAAWISSLLGGQLSIAGLALMFLLAPNGHLLSHRWRYAVWVVGLGAALCFVATVTMDPTAFRLQIESEVYGPARSAMLSIGFLAISGGLVASVVSMVRRLRRSRGERRQQVALIALSAALIAAGIVCLFVVQALNGGQQTWLAGLPLFVAYFLLPILLAVAVLRYRLYDVEVIIDRTVVVVLGTAFAAIGYTTLVVLVSNVVDEQTGGFGLSLLATTLVALAFQPLRRRVAHLADRLAYGSRAQPYQELSDFSRRLDEAPTSETLLPLVAAVAGQAVAARRVAVTLDLPGAAVPPAVWGHADPDGTDTHVVTVGDGGVDLGRIEVALPRGRHLRGADARRLEALADQAAVGFRNIALEAQLAGHVAELDRTTREIADARVRIIEADDAVRRHLEAAISRDVLPHLVAVADELDDVSDRPDTGRIDALVETVTRALEALRELTQGVYPTQLERWGLEPALRALVARTGTRTTLAVDESVVGLRFSPRVETAVYLCCLEAARADPPPAAVELRVEGTTLVERITQIGPDRLELQGVEDRVNAVGGRLLVEDGCLALVVPIEARQPAGV